jgi:hypothetical protein
LTDLLPPGADLCDSDGAILVRENYRPEKDDSLAVDRSKKTNWFSLTRDGIPAVWSIPVYDIHIIVDFAYRDLMSIEYAGSSFPITNHDSGGLGSDYYLCNILRKNFWSPGQK